MASSLPSHGSGAQGRSPAISRNSLPLPSPGQAGQGQLFQDPLDRATTDRPTDRPRASCGASPRLHREPQTSPSNVSDLCHRTPAAPARVFSEDRSPQPACPQASPFLPWQLWGQRRPGRGASGREPSFPSGLPALQGFLSSRSSHCGNRKTVGACRGGITSKAWARCNRANAMPGQRGERGSGPEGCYCAGTRACMYMCVCVWWGVGTPGARLGVRTRMLRLGQRRLFRGGV